MACVPEFLTITDSAFLDGLPVMSIIRDAKGYALQCEKRPGAWFYTDSYFQAAADDIPLPALLLWNPLWEADE
jgi:hypothetical protein